MPLSDGYELQSSATTERSPFVLTGSPAAPCAAAHSCAAAVPRTGRTSVLPLELLLVELELPLEPLPEAILPSGQSAVERALLLPLRPDMPPEFPVEPEVPEPELPVPSPCELLPLDEPPLVCDQSGCKQNASVLDRANAVMRIFRLLIRSCLLQFVMKPPTVAIELPLEGQGLCTRHEYLPTAFRKASLPAF